MVASKNLSSSGATLDISSIASGRYLVGITIAGKITQYITSLVIE
jgi:hypothetical protein